MARTPFDGTAIDKAGNVIQGARVYLSETGTTTPITDAYPSEVGGVVQAQFITNSDGQYRAWFDDADLPKRIRTRNTDNGHTAFYPSAPGTLLTFDDEIHDDVQVSTGGGETEGRGTWAQMQAVVSPNEGDIWYATDQRINYRYNDDAGRWLWAFGDSNKIRITDFGAVPTINTAPIRAQNTAAIRAATDRCRDVSDTSDRIVIVPAVTDGYIYYTDDHVYLNAVTMIGEGKQGGEFARTYAQAAIINTTAGGTAAKVDGTTGGGAIYAGTWIESMYFGGDVSALKVQNRAGVTVTRSTFVCNRVAANADNAAIVLENSFWLNFDYYSARCGGDPDIASGPSEDRGACSVLMIASDIPGKPIAGVGQTYFNHGIHNVGGMRYELRGTGGDGSRPGWSCHDVVFENAGSQAFQQIEEMPGAVAPFHEINGLRFDNCERADATGGDANAGFITVKRPAFGATGNMVVNGITAYKIDAYTPTLFKVLNGVGVYLVQTDFRFVFSAAYPPGNGGLQMLSMPGPSGGRALEYQSLGDGTFPVYSLESGVGSFLGVRNANQAEPYARWGVQAEGVHLLGPGTGPHDTMMGRGGVGFMFVPKLVKAGVPNDGDYAVAPPNGTTAINSLTDKHYYRKAGVWTLML